MSEFDFDRNSDGYRTLLKSSLDEVGCDPDKLLTSKLGIIERILSASFDDARGLDILDLGCGVGLLSARLAQFGGRVTGVDVSPASIAVAAEHAPDAAFVTYGGDGLPFRDNAFDCVVTSCVLHHVAPARRDRFLSEMFRVVRPAGLCLVLEHNPYNPVTRRIVSTCPMDEDAILLSVREIGRRMIAAGGVDIRTRFYGFCPWRSAWIDRVEKAIGWVPMGAQYMIWAKRPAR